VRLGLGLGLGGGLQVKRFVSHNLEVIAAIPAERLLVMDVVKGDGWDVLCPFLGLSTAECPSSTPFPRERRD